MLFPRSICQLRGIFENDLGGSPALQEGNTEAPSARGPSSLFVVWRICRNISVWKYVLLLSISGVTRERRRRFIGLAHSYID